MNAMTVIRAIVLVLLALALNSCATMTSRRWYSNYRPPTEINGYEFGSSITVQPEQIQLISGEGFEHWIIDEWRAFDINYAAYFNPDDTSPFAPAHVSNIVYLYCMIGDAPGLCGAKIAYESEEVDEAKGILAKIRRTNHERIVAELVARHGRPQYAEKYAQTIIEGEEETYRGPIERTQRRVWCDYSKGAPKRCKRSIIALFNAYWGHGEILYMDDRMYNYFQRYKGALKHEHVAMEGIKGEVKQLSAKDIAWHHRRSSTRHLVHGWMPKEKLHTEIQLEARAKELGRPRPQIARKLTEEEFAQEWIRSYVGARSKSATTLQSEYWWGYLEGIFTRNFDHQFNLTDEAHEKWVAGAQGSNMNLMYVGRGYTDSLASKRNPPKGFDPCEDKELSLWQRLKCALRRR